MCVRMMSIRHDQEPLNSFLIFLRCVTMLPLRQGTILKERKVFRPEILLEWLLPSVRTSPSLRDSVRTFLSTCYEDLWDPSLSRWRTCLLWSRPERANASRPPSSSSTAPAYRDITLSTNTSLSRPCTMINAILPKVNSYSKIERD